ncbi:DJ-1/PfpI family protein [Halomonas sp. M4R1S46]|uniref:DJ-1/PfpI family protein n=1 Tax=Halomonas sp. M4R1S46 TaxID=2982692 RepID=UPI0021E3E1EF|nr:DJ-1/PfpI family protein [Halomonas sp. M4R1S46]UYG09733.1 DJ-1/PfpI family protein [Halomonas sp. M4R1S46]
MCYRQTLSAAGEKPAVESRRVAFVLFEHFSLMAFTGGLDALVTANLVKASVEYEVTVVSVDGRRAMSDLGIEVAVDGSLDDLQEDELDGLMLCGGYRLELPSSPSLGGKLRAADYAGCVLGGLWTVERRSRQRPSFRLDRWRPLSPGAAKRGGSVRSLTRRNTRRRSPRRCRSP